MSTSEPTCESCGNPLPSDALVCIKCGFDRRLGARRGLKRDRRRGKKEEITVDPDSVWEIFAPVAAFISPFARSRVIWIVLAAAMVPMVIVPYVFTIVYTVAGVFTIILIGWISLIAYEESVACFLCVLFVPFYVVYYVITRWEEESKTPFHMFVVTVAIILILCVVYIVRLVASLFVPA